MCARAPKPCHTYSGASRVGHVTAFIVCLRRPRTWCPSVFERACDVMLVADPCPRGMSERKPLLLAPIARRLSPGW